MAYICLNCGNEYDVSYLKSEKNYFVCPNKNCRSKLYEVDNMLIPIILFLFNKGFDIKDSHTNCLNDNGIVKVEMSLVLSRYVKGLFLSKEITENLFEFIDKYAEIVYNDSDIIIRFYKDNLSLKEAFYQMSNNSSILLDWCINIVSPICQELDSSWCEGEEVSEDMDRSVGYEENNDCISD